MANERPLTFAEVLALLYCQVTPDDPDDTENKFRDVLNQALETIYSEAVWEGTKSRGTLNDHITDNVINLPYEYDAMLAVMVDGSPVEIFEEGLEFNRHGVGEQKAGEGGCVVIDCGFSYQDDSTNQERMIRSYKFTMDVTNCEVTGILKKRFHCITTRQDLVVPSNVRALKLALMAVMYEDEGDLESSKDYWEESYRILNSEKQVQNIGVTKPPIQDPWGIAGNKPENLM